MFLSKEALALFLYKKFKGVKCVCQVIEDDKSHKTIESYVGDIKEFIEFLGDKRGNLRAVLNLYGTLN